MKYLIIFGLAVSICGSVFAVDSPSKLGKLYTSFQLFKSSVVTADFEEYENVNLSSGIVQLLGVYVSSVGVNSELKIYDNRLAGNTTNLILQDNTNTAGTFLPIHYESERGIVFTSTCTACFSAWSPPRLRFIYDRVR